MAMEFAFIKRIDNNRLIAYRLMTPVRFMFIK